MTDEQYMEMAIEEALKGNFPFGALIVKNDEVIAKAHNTAGLDPTAHAEINAIRNACKKLKDSNLDGCVLYTTCEPCPMCFTAAWWANISIIVYGTEGEDVTEEDWKINIKCEELNKRSGNKIQIKSGVLRDKCLNIFK